MAEGQTEYKRPSWDAYFLEIKDAIAKRGTCERGRSGCVIAKNNQVISAGYVGSPIGEDHCDDVGHLFQERLNKDGTISKHCVRTVHAEQNAVCQAARRGVSVDGATLYCQMTPCPVCAKMIINCGIKRVVCQKKYHDGAEAERLFLRAGVALEHMSEKEEQYIGKGSKDQDVEWRPEPLSTEEGKLKVKKLNKTAIAPGFAYQKDAGMDLYSSEDVEIDAGGRTKVATGIAIELPEGYVGLIWDKSGVSLGRGLKTLGGVIDSGYRGEIFVGFVNVSVDPVSISKGEKIAQLLVQKVEKPEIVLSEELSTSERGEGGYGSSDFKKIDPMSDLGLDYLPEEDNELDEVLEEETENEGSAEELNKIEEKEDGKSRW